MWLTQQQILSIKHTSPRQTSKHLLNSTMYPTRLTRSSFLSSNRSLSTSLSLPQLHRRKLHLAPPFLLDDYIPRYHLLSSIDASKKRSAAYAHLRNCNLCPRLCGVNRYEKTGTCLIGAETVKVNVRFSYSQLLQFPTNADSLQVIAPHFGEGSFCESVECVSSMIPDQVRKDVPILPLLVL
jgi:hypothetical protein